MIREAFRGFLPAGEALEKTAKRVAPGSSTEACRAQLQRVLDSPDFNVSDRDRRFLAFVVGESLAGRADRIKAYTIAVEVFGRGAGFDPKTDPIVRVEAGHLRRALDRYYRGAGRSDPIVITIPKGGYAPLFNPNPNDEGVPHDAPQATDTRARRLWRTAPVMALVLLAFLAGAGTAAAVLSRVRGSPAPNVPRLAVVPLQVTGTDRAASVLAEGLTSEIVAEVARFRDIVVVAPSGNAVLAPRYVLEGHLTSDGPEIRIQLWLHRRESEEVIWAENYALDLQAERRLAAQARIASQVATAIGQPYGAVFQADAAARAGSPFDTRDAYACTLSYFDFRANLDQASYQQVLACLEEAVARYPEYATAWGLLAQIHVDGHRFGFVPDAPVEQVLSEARRALVLDPSNVRALQAKMMGLYLSGDIEGAIRVGAAAAAINPNDTELLGEYGYRLALSGRWDQGCATIQDAVERNPGPLPYYETGLALCDYIAGRYDAAAARIRAAAFPQLPIYHLVAAALYAEAGQSGEARRESDWLTANAPDLLQNLSAQVAPRLGRPEDFQKFLGSLERAGIAPGQVAHSPSQ
jgi:TolB-like protein/Tfp pilus assembly protein PilF